MDILRATSTYGKTFKPTKNPNEYSLMIYTGGMAGAKTARERLEVEIAKFMETTDYTKYEVVRQKFRLFPSGFKFRVRFE